MKFFSGVIALGNFALNLKVAVVLASQSLTIFFEGRININKVKDLRIVWKPPLLFRFLRIGYTLPGSVTPSRGAYKELQELRYIDYAD